MNVNIDHAESTKVNAIGRNGGSEKKDIFHKHIDNTCNNGQTIIKYDRNEKILLRKKKLLEQLDDNKIRYIKNGICDAYIKYGYPSLDDVVVDLQQKTEKQMNRYLRLLNRLKKEGEIYDENNTYYRNYIINGGDIETAVKEGIKEWFYKNKTEYYKFLEIYKDEDIAQIKAFNKYVKHNGFDKYIEKIRKDEMTLKFY